MCDAMTEPPRPGTELFCYWNEPLPMPVAGERREFTMGDWLLFVEILKVKDSRYKPDRKAVTMKVIG